MTCDSVEIRHFCLRMLNIQSTVRIKNLEEISSSLHAGNIFFVDQSDGLFWFYTLQHQQFLSENHYNITRKPLQHTKARKQKQQFYDGLLEKAQIAPNSSSVVSSNYFDKFRMLSRSTKECRKFLLLTSPGSRLIDVVSHFQVYQPLWKEHDNFH